MDLPNTEVLGIDICDVFLLHHNKSFGRPSYSSAYASLSSDNMSMNQKSLSSASQKASQNTADNMSNSNSAVSNIRFEQCNVIDGILYPDNHFHYIHQAHMIFAYTKPQWKQVLQEATRVLAPGGYIELLEVEFPCRRTGPKAAPAMELAFKKVGDREIDAGLAVDLRELLRCAGLTEISGTFISVPLGDWNREENYIGELE